MIRRHASLYLSARVVAALTNIFAVAVFTRLAGREVYGGYLVMSAAASVVNGFAVQWLRYAFFARYRAEQSAVLVATFAAMVAASLAMSLPVAALVLVWTGQWPMAMGAILLATTIGVFDATTEVFRTQLEVNRVVAASLMRTALVVVLGSAAVWSDAHPLSLALGVAGANLLATVPSLLRLRRLLVVPPRWEVARQFLVFGWPLLMSFGIGAFAQGVDRFVLDHFGGAAAVGAYGAASDFVRASFVVVGEGLAASLVSIAKQQHTAGDETAAAATLSIAYKLFLLLCGFGIAGFSLFGDLVFSVMFSADFRQGFHGLMPMIVAAAALMAARNLYFGQIIYFTAASHLELVSTLILLVVNTTCCLMLVPSMGARGAAWGYLAGQIVSTLFFVIYRRGTFRMPILARPTLGMAALVLALVAWGWGVDAAGLGLVPGLAARMVAMAVALVGAAYAMGVRRGFKAG